MVEKLSAGIDEEIERLVKPMRERMADCMVQVMKAKVGRAQERRELAGSFLLIYLCNFHVLNHFLLIYICNFHVLNHFLLIFICKLRWNRQVGQTQPDIHHPR
jgi:hypothetical protein